MTEIMLNGKQYTIKSRIGKGGQGIVWEAENGGAKPIVLKELYGIVAEENITQVEDPEVSDVQKQIQMLRELQEVPGIPTLIDAGFADDRRFYVAMNRVPGKTLEEQVNEGKRYTKPEAEHMLRQLLTTLGECHAHGLIHRDVKPENIKIHDGQATFVDVSSFGDALAKTQRTAGIGTLGYIAPEQKEMKTKPWSDIYGLGKTMYRILTREEVPAFTELTTEDFDGIRTVYEAGFANILEKMCQPEVARRYKTVQEVLHDLVVGDVTETFALVNTEKNKRTATSNAKKSFFSKAWDWMRYDHKVLEYHEGRVHVYKKRFGDGSDFFVLDDEQQPIYRTDTLNLKGIIKYYPTDKIILNKERYSLFIQKDDKYVLISRSGKIFGKPFDGYSTFNGEEGTTTEYIKVKVKPELDSKHGHVAQYMGKDGFVGICEEGTSNLSLWNKDGWTWVMKNNKNAVVLPDGTLFGGQWFNGVFKVKTDALDSSGVLYIPVKKEDSTLELITQQGERFGPKLKCWSREKNNDTVWILREAAFEIWNGKEYAHCAWEHYQSSSETHKDIRKHTYVARDGSFIGGKEGWDDFTILNGPQEQYAVCEEYEGSDRKKTTVKVVDKNNALLFGGAHASWRWYSPQGGLEAMCLVNKVKEGGIDRDKITVKNKEGKELYLTAEENAEGISIQKINDNAITIGPYVIRNVVIGYLQNRMAESRSGTYSFPYQEWSNSSQLRTQDGTVICFDGDGEIQSFDKTADNKLSVLYSNGTTKVIDVLEVMKKTGENNG